MWRILAEFSIRLCGVDQLYLIRTQILPKNYTSQNF